MTSINTESPEYVFLKSNWGTYWDLYAGGEQMKANATRYLQRRQKEPLDVYSERLSRVYYENYVGSIIDWYAATLFRREPMVMVEGENDSGKSFFSKFAEDCDSRGSSLSEFFRHQMIETLVFGCSYVLVDFPRVIERVGTRAEEEALGASRAYLVGYSPEQVINWSRDKLGNYEWVVVRTNHTHKESPDSGAYIRETRWTYYSKTDYQVYSQVHEEGGGKEIELIDSGKHGLAKQWRVPVFELKVPEGLWLMNKAGLLQLEHFNKSNALSWALNVGLFASPVVYSDRDWNQIVGESYYIQLGPEDKFGWTEPEGRVFQIAAENLGRLQEEIYRVCYLLSQGGGRSSSASVQSGLSKQRDFAITHEVLRAYGDIVKDTMKRVLRSVGAAREDGLAIDVSGLDEFDIGDFTSELSDAERLLNLGIPSPTLRKQVFKKLAFKYLCDVRQEVKDRIAREIELEVTEPAFE